MLWFWLRSDSRRSSSSGRDLVSRVVALSTIGTALKIFLWRTERVVIVGPTLAIAVLTSGRGLDADSSRGTSAATFDFIAMTEENRLAAIGVVATGAPAEPSNGTAMSGKECP